MGSSLDECFYWTRKVGVLVDALVVFVFRARFLPSTNTVLFHETKREAFEVNKMFSIRQTAAKNNAAAVVPCCKKKNTA